MTGKPERELRVGRPRALSIAGSDSGGGAGIQADLKAFAACGVHGMTAITAVTAQNTVAVEAVEPVAPAMIVAQVKAVVEDIGVDAVKVGMLGTVETIAAVADALALTGDGPVVVDPVMVAESGASLLEMDARASLISDVLPLADVATPNIPEARALTGLGPQAGLEELGRAVIALGPKAAVVTGGHSDRLVDLLVTEDGSLEIEGPRHPGADSHGSGCTHSSALAAGLASGLDLESAVRQAREVASAAVARALTGLGGGPGPVDSLGIGSREPERPE